jgi:hypothetical protein
MLPAVGTLPDSCDVLASGCLQLPDAIGPAFQGAVGGYLRVPVRLSQCNQLPGREKQGADEHRGNADRSQFRPAEVCGGLTVSCVRCGCAPMNRVRGMSLGRSSTAPARLVLVLLVNVIYRAIFQIILSAAVPVAIVCPGGKSVIWSDTWVYLCDTAGPRSHPENSAKPGRQDLQ